MPADEHLFLHRFERTTQYTSKRDAIRVTARGCTSSLTTASRLTSFWKSRGWSGSLLSLRTKYCFRGNNESRLSQVCVGTWLCSGRQSGFRLSSVFCLFRRYEVDCLVVQRGRCQVLLVTCCSFQLHRIQRYGHGLLSDLKRKYYQMIGALHMIKKYFMGVSFYT